MNQFTYEVVTNQLGIAIIKRTSADGEERWIPTDPGNTDYKLYLASLEGTE